MGVKTGDSMKTSSNNGITTPDQTPPPLLWFSQRFFVAVVLFLGFVNAGVMMTNMSIAIVEMTSNKTIVEGDRTFVRPAEFQWDPSVVGLISSVISYGGFFSLLGGVFVNKLGGSMSCTLFTMLGGIVTIVQPPALYASLSVYIVLRLLTGFFVNSFCVSTAEIFSRWFPRRERSTLICFCVSGMNVGVTISNPICGYIADRWGWQMVCYVTGAASLVVAWLILKFVKNTPTHNAKISSEELSYILDGTRESSQKVKNLSHPYKEILTSPPVWALCIAEFVMLWVLVAASSVLPLYAKDSIGGSTDEIGVISSLPVAVTIIGYPLGGRFMDYWRNHSSMKPTQIDKLVIVGAFLFIGVFFAVCVIVSSFVVSMIMFTLILVTVSIVPAVYEPNIVNIAPNDSSIVSALAKISNSVSSVISRTLIGYLTIDHSTQGWNNCFLLCSVVVVVGAVIYARSGSSEAQWWSLLSDSENEYDHLIEAKNAHTNGIRSHRK